MLWINNCADNCRWTPLRRDTILNISSWILLCLSFSLRWPGTAPTDLFGKHIAGLPHCSQRSRKYFGASANIQHNSYSLSFSLLPLAVCCMLNIPAVRIKWEGNSSSLYPFASTLFWCARSLSLSLSNPSLSPSLSVLPVPWQSRQTHEQIPQVCSCKLSRAAPGDTHTWKLPCDSTPGRGESLRYSNQRLFC